MQSYAQLAGNHGLAVAEERHEPSGCHWSNPVRKVLEEGKNRPRKDIKKEKPLTLSLKYLKKTKTPNLGFTFKALLSHTGLHPCLHGNIKQALANICLKLIELLEKSSWEEL
ncbi:UNVERIFIED_CONTAM: hypothetical protein K2H54_045607 [Gekko kuhli]